MNSEREHLRRLREGRCFGLSCGLLGNGAERIGVYLYEREVGIRDVVFIGENARNILLLALMHLREFRVLALGIKVGIHQRIITLE